MSNDEPKTIEECILEYLMRMQPRPIAKQQLAEQADWHWRWQFNVEASDQHTDDFDILDYMKTSIELLHLEGAISLREFSVIATAPNPTVCTGYVYVPTRFRLAVRG